MNESASSIKIAYRTSGYGYAGNKKGVSLREKSSFPNYTTFSDYLVDMIE